MNTKALASLAELICRAQEQDRTPMGIAFAIDAAGRHMSPEVAAEFAALKAQVAALLAERHVTNGALSDAAERMRADRDRIAELEAERDRWRQFAELDVDKLAQALLLIETGPALPWAHTMSDHDLSGFLDDLLSAAMGRWQSSPEVPDREVLAAVEKACARWKTPGEGSRLDGSEFDGVTVRIAPTQALREVPDGEHAASVHHDYRTPRDLPELGGQR